VRTAWGSRWPSVLLVWLGWALTAASAVVTVLLQQRLLAAGRGDLGAPNSQGLPFVVGMLSSATVGGALAIRRPGHPVGWLFLGLGFSIGIVGTLDAYGAYGAIAVPGAVPGAELAVVLGDAGFIPWLVLIALILLLTPTGAPPTPRWRAVVIVAVLGGAVLMVTKLFLPLDPPLDAVTNPMALTAAGGSLQIVRMLAVAVTIGSVLMAAASLLLRFRSAAGIERRQLRWIAMAAVPLPILVLGTLVGSIVGQPLVVALLAAAFLAMLPIAAGFAITQFHLYEVDRLLSRALTYVLLTVLVLGCYVAVVIAVGEGGGTVSGGSTIATGLATLAAVSIAGPARRRLQDGLDRRFNRREFDAVRVVQRYVREPTSDTTIEEAMRAAVADPGLRVAYWIDDRARWVDQDGHPADPHTDGIEVQRRASPVASVGFEPGRVERHIVAAVVAAARPELENARLRAAIGLQLVEVRESRSRIVAAQLAERRKLERNLHDGAQQRLLAVALQLRAAELSKDPDRVLGVLPAAIAEIQLGILELRDLANGLHPTVLGDGELAAALEGVASHSSVQVRLAVTEDRFTPELEATAWFIVCEAVANAVKHGQPESIEIEACRHAGSLLARVYDDGIGGADPWGRGLRGIADRAEAAGGSLRVEQRVGGGTIVTAQLPCES